MITDENSKHLNMPTALTGNVDYFSRQWIEETKNIDIYIGQLADRHIGQVTPTMTKLDGLIERLKRLKSNPLFEGIKIGSLEWMRSQVGVWYIKKTLMGSAWYVRNETTKTWESDWEGKRETYAWNDHVWGAEKKEGLILIMLSSDAIRWLNEVSTWLDSKERMYGI